MRGAGFLFLVDMFNFSKVQRLARFMAFGNRYLPPIFALTADRQKSIFQLILADCFPAVYN